MQAATASGLDWRDAAAYAPLRDADRSFFAWEWLRRDLHYRAAAERALSAGGGERREDPAAAAFGLVGFEAPSLGVPDARPLWRSEVHPQVLIVEAAGDGGGDDAFTLERLGEIAVLLAGGGEHLLLSDGLRALRLDGPPGAFSRGPRRLRYGLEGLAGAEPRLLVLNRFLALCRTGRFARSLHRRESRARRWILMLRAWDALASGADQRQIAAELLGRSAAEPRWRSREPSLRSQAQRLVHSARRFAAGDYRILLRPNCSIVRHSAHFVTDERKNA